MTNNHDGVQEKKGNGPISKRKKRKTPLVKQKKKKEMGLIGKIN